MRPDACVAIEVGLVVVPVNVLVSYNGQASCLDRLRGYLTFLRIIFSKSKVFVFHIKMEMYLLPVESHWMIHVDFLCTNDKRRHRTDVHEEHRKDVSNTDFEKCTRSGNKFIYNITNPP